MVDSVSNNQNNNPTAGKLIGAVTGAGVATGYWINSKKYIKTADEFLSSEKLKAAVDNNNLDDLIKVTESSKIKAKNAKKFIDCFKVAHEHNVLKEAVKKCTDDITLTKRFFLPVALFLSAATILLGTGAGAIVDHFRKD